MKTIIKKDIRSKAVKVLLVVLTVATISLYGLRSVLAISLFEGLTGSMQSSGWLSPGSDSLMQVHEEVTYEASYLLVKIGSVRFQVIGKTIYDDVPAYRLRAYIDSYSGIPFVNLHAVYETYADARTFMCLQTSNSQKEGNDWVYTTYHFDFNKKTVQWQQSKNGALMKTVDYPLDRDYTDGVSFFYYLRESCKNAAGRRMNLTIPIAVDTIRSSVYVSINEGKEQCETTAYDFTVDSYRLSGHLNFQGFFGITGDFTGWMSPDSAAVPLKGNVKVILGSVVVKLKDIKREHWVPQRSAGK